MLKAYHLKKIVNIRVEIVYNSLGGGVGAELNSNLNTV